MRKTTEVRISRLQTQKQGLQGQMRTLQETPDLRNKEFKVDRLNDRVLTITDKIIELKEIKK